MTKHRGFYPKCNGASDRALPPDQPHLDGIALIRLGQDRHEPFLDEVKMLHRDSRMMQNASRGQGHFLQQWVQALQILVRQGSQQEITRKRDSLVTARQSRLVLSYPHFVEPQGAIT